MKLSDLLFKDTYICGITIKKSKGINKTVLRIVVTSERQEVIGLGRDPRHREIQRYCYVLFLKLGGGYIAVHFIILYCTFTLYALFHVCFRM